MVMIVKGSVVDMDTDAIVNAANESLLGGGGVDGAIHRASGPELLAECRTLGGCPTGSAKPTKGYGLKARYVIHAVGPVYIDGRHGEESLLRSCYSTALGIAEGMGLESIAFPIISGGVYGYPRRDAIRIALEELGKTPMRATLCCYLEDEYRTAEDILAGMRP